MLFTDIVGSTDLASSMGDQRWRDLIDRHNTLVRDEFSRWRGNEIVTTGDGFLATFDSPTEAIHCANRIVKSVQALDIEVRCGIHTGMIEVMDRDVTGLAVNIGARIAALADPSEVLVSQTVRDLVAGTNIDLEDRGNHKLKRVSNSWQVFAAIPRSS